MKETIESTQSTLIQISPEGNELRILAEMLRIFGASEDLFRRLSSLSRRIDFLVHKESELSIAVKQVDYLSNENRELRGLDEADRAMIMAIVREMQKRGSCIQTSGTTRNVLTSLLKHLTVVNEDGEVRYDNTNKLVHPIKEQAND